jgi:hypothetical protein
MGLGDMDAVTLNPGSLEPRGPDAVGVPHGWADGSGRRPVFVRVPGPPRPTKSGGVWLPGGEEGDLAELASRARWGGVP